MKHSESGVEEDFTSISPMVANRIYLMDGDVVFFDGHLKYEAWGIRLKRPTGSTFYPFFNITMIETETIA